MAINPELQKRIALLRQQTNMKIIRMKAEAKRQAKMKREQEKEEAEREKRNEDLRGDQED
jgi:hypothetical protein